jgi:hypothetical protein
MLPPTVKVFDVLMDRVTPGPPVTELPDPVAWVNMMLSLLTFVNVRLPSQDPSSMPFLRTPSPLLLVF